MPKNKSFSKSSKRKPVSASGRTAQPESKGGNTRKDQLPFAAPAETVKNAQVLAKSSTPARTAAAPGLPAEAAMSFLRDTKGLVSWTLRELSQTLKISRGEAERVVALLQIQGYVQQHKPDEWITTPSGETVSGAKPPRFDRETVEAALTSLGERIQSTNKDRAAKFQITRAVAFGDFLAKDRARVQSADVGIELVRRDRAHAAGEITAPHSAVDAREEQHFLRQLRGRSALLNLKLYSEWMGARTHQKFF